LTYELEVGGVLEDGMGEVALMVMEEFAPNIESARC
jgi:hypothetical protein